MLVWWLGCGAVVNYRSKSLVSLFPRALSIVNMKSRSILISIWQKYENGSWEGKASFVFGQGTELQRVKAEQSYEEQGKWSGSGHARSKCLLHTADSFNVDNLRIQCFVSLNGNARTR